MSVYFYWGEETFARDRAVKALQTKVLDPDWSSFNYDRLEGDHPEAILQGLNQALTPPFGAGHRFVWLANTTLGQRCPEGLLAELERTIALLPETTLLLFTSDQKPDGRLKSTKFLQKNATFQEFSTIPPWKTDQLIQQVKQVATELDVKLTQAAITTIAEAVGNNTRQLYSELEKISLLASHEGQKKPKPLDVEAIAPLITSTSQNTLKLFTAIRQGKTAEALELVTDILRQNEPAPVIVRTLVGQFRQRLWIKLLLTEGERDDGTIAQAAEVNNPKQIYFLRQEVASLSLTALQQTLPVLMALEFGLKRGADELAALQTAVIQLCQILQEHRTDKGAERTASRPSTHR
ncbi:MAG: DNA polymerase III subunit delta [Synechococcales bacterium]|nr:DNA polymerase III subunit delta [Synechococcales bacterium]